jgi:molybdenum cofactor cytidylyltransferase
MDKLIPSTPVGLVILAAGSSSRMGQPKQLLPYDGESLVRRSARLGLLSGCFPVTVVLGANSLLIGTELEDLPVFVTENPDWEAGMASSIRVGLAHTLHVLPTVAAVIITLCDQPLITPAFLHGLTEVFAAVGKPIVATRYGNTTGVPALFSRELFDTLEGLSGQEGARKLIAGHPDQVHTVSFPEAALDVDTPEDYLKLIGGLI